MNLKKLLTIGSIGLLIISNIVVFGTLYVSGSDSEKSNILTATVWKLAEEGKTNNDIEQIEVRYNPFKGGELPYNVYVSFKEDVSNIKIYSWADKEKKEIEFIGITAK